MNRARQLLTPAAMEADLFKALGESLDQLCPRVTLDSSAYRVIPEDMRFRAWCDSVAGERLDPVSGELRPGLLVDGKPFKLDDRPAMAWIYEQVPSTREEAQHLKLILRKCAQVGFTVMEMLMVIYFALKFEPLKIGMFVPSMNLAHGKSAERFMPILRSIPEGYDKLPKEGGGRGGQRSVEGNVTLRRIGESLVHCLWTSGKSTTESYPMDIVTFDEVQEMKISAMEKVHERMSASRFKCTLMGSTANWPDADIDYWYKKGSRHRFHTACPTCGVKEPLDDYFPDCIQFDPTFPDCVTGAPGDYRYVCRAGHWIDDPQQGEWIAEDHDAAARKIISIHFHQMLSPTITPREMYEAYLNADDMKNYFNRKLGKPYQDPSQIPVTLEHLNACASAGMERGLEWKTRARRTFMGIDQMGKHNVVVIKEAMDDGRQAVVHVEEIYGADPFARCDQLMMDYGVRICVVEQLPNFNDAMRFGNRHEGRVFLLTGYGDLADDVIRWGDGPQLDVSERRTNEEERTRYTVRVDQYKAMSTSLARFVNCTCLFPDPQALVQEIRTKNAKAKKAVLKDVAFLHFQRTALVTDRVHEGERKLRRRVVKVGIDPHFSYANMLCDVAWSRAYGTATFILPEMDARSRPSENRASQANAAVPESSQLSQLIEEATAERNVCGNCAFYPMLADGPPPSGHCPELAMTTDATALACDLFDRSV